MKLSEMHKLLWEASEPEHHTVWLQLAIPHFSMRRDLYFPAEIFNDPEVFRRNLEDSIETLMVEDLEEKFEKADFTEEEARNFGNCKIYGFVILYSVLDESNVLLRLPIDGECFTASTSGRDIQEVRIRLREIDPE